MGARTSLVEEQDAFQLCQVAPGHDAVHLARRACLAVVVGQLQGMRESDGAEAGHLEHLLLRGLAEHARVDGVVPVAEAQAVRELGPVSLDERHRRPPTQRLPRPVRPEALRVPEGGA
eukprot:9364689-Alexandrium_andersonii.AAC.1